MFLIVGLGNPGLKYENNRHNFGFLSVDKIIKDYDLSFFKDRFGAMVYSGLIFNNKVFIVKPQKYMNLSGCVVHNFSSFYKILPKNIIVIYDDVDIDLGRIKIKTGGRSGGHNGIKNIDNFLKPYYMKVRLGIGGCVSEYDTKDYVLKNFNKSEFKTVDIVINKVSKNIKHLLDGDIVGFLNKFYL